MRFQKLCQPSWLVRLICWMSKKSVQYACVTAGRTILSILTLAVNRTLSSEQSHEIAIKAEKAIQERLPDATVTIHMDPIHSRDEKLAESLNILAAQFGLGMHHIRVLKANDQTILTLHLDVDKEMPLVEAHERASRFEAEIHNVIPGIQQIWTHLEPISRQSAATSETAIYQDEEVEKLIRCLPEWEGVSCGVEDILVLREKDRLDVSIRCSSGDDISVDRAHDITEKLEAALREHLPGLRQVIIHIEPHAPAG